jgi:hypothetical protein
MMLFHVASRKLDIGPCCPLTQPRQWPDAMREDMEQNLESRRPAGKPSRRTAFYAFGSLEEALSYANADDVLKVERYFHKVDMQVELRTAMALASFAYTGHPKLSELCAEYWDPQIKWSLWEYLGHEMTVIEHISEATITDYGLGLMRLMQDRNRIAKVFSA